MQGRLLIYRRDAHQADHRQAQFIPAQADEGIGVQGQDAGLLVFLAGVDLNIALRPATCFFHFPGQGAGQLWPIDGFDNIKKRNGVFDLVALQRPDQVQADMGELLFQGRPFCFCFLHLVFAELPLPGLDHGADALGRVGLADANQRDAVRIAPGRFRGGGDGRAGGIKILCNIGFFGYHMPVGLALMDGTLSVRTLSDRKSQRKLPPMFLLTDAVRLADPLAAAARLAPESGVILRHYGVPDRARLARDLSLLCHAHGLVLLIAATGPDDARLALDIGAAGLHLPERRVCATGGAWRLWRRPDWLVTAAAHSPAALMRASRAGADAALLSPVYGTASHPGAPPIGPLRFALWAGRAPLPVYALGGMADGDRLARLGGSRAAGWAGIAGAVAADK